MKKLIFLLSMFPFFAEGYDLSESDKLKCRIYATQAAQREASALSTKLHAQVAKETNDIRAKENKGEVSREEANRYIQFRRNWEILEVGKKQRQVRKDAEQICLRSPSKIMIESTEINIHDKYPIQHYFELSQKDRAQGIQ